MAHKKIFLVGASGMLGQELSHYLKAKGYEVTGVNSQTFNLLGNYPDLAQKVALHEPDIIINCAAMTNVDQSEQNPELAMAINKDGPWKLALITQELNAILVHVSTDYVFGAADQRTPYTVEDKPAPVNLYGESKLYGELMIKEILEEYYILRTSWLYGIHGRNFVQFILDATKQGQSLNIVSDQIGCPTWVGNLCPLIERIMTSGAYGTYHTTDRGSVSRYEQALTVCSAAGLSSSHIKPIASREFAQPAKRPYYSVLDVGELAVPTWETSLQAYLQQYLSPA